MNSKVLNSVSHRAARWATGIGLALVSCAALAGFADYSYDTLGRLTAIRYSNGVSVFYNYDAAGNRTSFVVSGAPS